jgi:hypothetical protein
MPGCKAPEILRNKAYLEGTSLTMDKCNAAGGRFSSAPSSEDPDIHFLSLPETFHVGGNDEEPVALQ